ncbi:helix-turn-helix domain-containing protein [Phocaeicola coprophilus]|uniref:helix-turn-helix domain-containing protein n=1 Tax=Phocaeicola coprophilus TaxID=387090 RepID=UPI003996788B
MIFIRIWNNSPATPRYFCRKTIKTEKDEAENYRSGACGGIQGKSVRGTDGRTGGEHTEVGEGTDSLPKMRIRLAEYGNDTELMLAAVSALRKDKEAPSARDRDFRAWMLMLCRSREHEVICYMCNGLTDAWERKYRTREMLVLCDVLHTLKGHARANEMTNRVCDYFFRERRNKLYGKTFRIEEKDMAYAESRLPELDKAVFRMTVNHYSHRTFVAEELAGLCGMGYSLMRRKFKTYYGMGPSEWLRRERIRRIEEDMEYRVELPLKKVAERNAFGSASNFADFCQKQAGMSPCELKAIGYEKWEKRRMDFWNR